MKPFELKTLVTAVKDRVDILEVVTEQGVCVQNNKSLCPFHEEKTPSFHLNVKDQYFYCFACGKGGDVIRFVELYKKIPFVEALKELAAEAGVPMTAFEPDELRKIEAEQATNDILRLTTDFYHRSLTEEAKRYLTDERGFSEETIEKYQIGYAAGGLRAFLAEHRVDLTQAEQAGVLKAHEGKLRDYFYERIIFPNMVYGRVVQLTGRRLDGREPKYLHLSGKNKHLFNESACRNATVLICEGVPDCLAALQAGFTAVAVYGTYQFKAEHASLFYRCETVYLCLDGDDAGRQAALRIGQHLPGKAVIVSLPDGQDINEFVKLNGTAGLQQLLDNGKPYLDVRIAQIQALPDHPRSTALEEFLPILQSLTSFQRNRYRDQIAKAFKIGKKTLDDGIDRPMAEPAVSDEPTSTEPKSEAAEAERAAALALLKDPLLLEKINAALEAEGCVGEENNKIITYLAMTSRKSDHPISLIVKGDSSGGKSFLVQSVGKLFPEDDLKMFTALSSRALFHRSDSLAHKVLMVFERPGAEESDYPIRTLQSENKLVFSTSVKNPETQEWEAKDITVDGPIAYIETTTQPHLHPENETRCFEIFIDDSEGQTQRIQEVIRRQYLPADQQTKPDLRPFVVAQTLLRSLPVTIPYVDHINFPDKPLRVRRDFQRFLTLIETSALLHQYQREIQVHEGQEYIVANFEDYAIAFELASVVLQASIKQLSPKGEELAHLVNQHVDAETTRVFTARQLRDEVRWDMKTVKKYLGELVDQGLVDIASASRGNATQYKFVRLPDQFDNLLLSPEKLRHIVEAKSLANLGKPGEMPFGQVNPIPPKELSSPDQLGRLPEAT